MPACVAVNCTNRSDQRIGKTFHKFPHKDPPRLKEWLVKMRRDNWKPGTYSVICSDHFEQRCFDRTGQTTRLRADAVPTLFTFPAHLIKTVRSRKPPLKRNCDVVPQPVGIPPEGPEPGNDSSEPPEAITQAGVDATLLFTPKNAKPLSHDHTYYTGESPRSVKRKFDSMFDRASSMQKKLKNSQAKSRRLRKKVSSLQDVINAVEDKHLLSEGGLDMVKKTCDVPGVLMKRLVRGRKSGRGSKEKYPPALRSFALTLHFYSAKAYRFVRKTFDLRLPHPSVIRKWYSTVDGKPGFTDEAFRTLEMKSKEAKEKGQELVLSLMLDEMAIKKHIQWDGKQFHGYVDIGTEDADDSNPVASDALVFMVVAVNASWKLPVGYFLISGMSGIERANLVEQCLNKLADIGVWVSALTCDGPSCHLKMLETLGATMTLPHLKPSFPHPSDPHHPVSVFLDICHMLKLMKNALASYGLFKDGDGGVINWEYVKGLNKVQEEEGLRLGNKVRNAHIQWQKQKMKVNLAAQTLSQSVADALEFLCEQGLSQFRGCEATVRFIRIVDRLFDVLNSRTPFGRNFKAPLRSANENVWRPFFREAQSYLESLTDAQGKKMYTTKRKTPFIGFLCGIKSAESMYDTLVGGDSPKLKYLLMYKMSQDHIELFFCAVRSSLGCNNNPTARQFSSSYKKLLIRHEIEGIGGNCEAQDQTSILHVASSVTPVISDGDSERDMLLVRKYDLTTTEPTTSDHDYTDMPNLSKLSQYKKSVIHYVAGYVVRMAKQRVSCEECISALTTGEVLGGSLLEKKNRGGLVRPTADVVRVCEVTDVCLQRLLHTTSGQLPQQKGVAQALCIAVLSEVGHLNIFRGLSDHMFDCPPDHNHVYLLIKCLASCYLKIRMHHLARRMNEQVSGPAIRKKLTKLVLFKHQ